jgi:uncharacterized RDD family membrane protein YckC
MPWLLIRRATAYSLDIVLLFLVLFSVGRLVRLATGWHPSSSPTGLEVWLAIALNFSVPTWTYFVWSDRSACGATVGKRLLGLRVVRVTGERVSTARALARTAVKVLPWETAHVSAFALSTNPGVSFDLSQLIGLTLANGLAVVYLAVAGCTGGRRSVHDYVAATEVCRLPGRSTSPHPTRPASPPGHEAPSSRPDG